MKAEISWQTVKKNIGIIISAALALIAIAVSWNANLIARQANEVARQQLGQARRQTAIADTQRALSLADHPKVDVRHDKASRELDPDPERPNHSRIKWVYRICTQRAAKPNDVTVRMGVDNLDVNGYRGSKNSFFEGMQVVQRRFEGSEVIEGTTMSLRGVVPQMKYGLMRVLYEATWSYGSPTKTGLSVGEFVYVHESVWPRVYRVKNDCSGPEAPKMSALVTSLSDDNVSQMTVRWYNYSAGNVKVHRVPRSQLVSVGYLVDDEDRLTRTGRIDGGTYPSVIVRARPGEDHAEIGRLNDGEEVYLGRIVGRWAYVWRQSDLGRPLTAWVAARCVECAEKYQELPVRQPFEGWTRLRVAHWSSTEHSYSASAVGNVK